MFVETLKIIWPVLTEIWAQLYVHTYKCVKCRTIIDSHDGSNNKQKVNNNRTTALERRAALATGTKSSP